MFHEDAFAHLPHEMVIHTEPGFIFAKYAAEKENHTAVHISQRTTFGTSAIIVPNPWDLRRLANMLNLVADKMDPNGLRPMQ